MHAKPQREISAASAPSALRTPHPEIAHRHALRVYWEDTDAAGVVFYANYLKFFERARTEWLRSLGFSQQRMLRRDGVLFVVAEATLRCHRAARLDDALDITVRVLRRGGASMRIDQQAWRGDELVAEGQIRIGCVSARPGPGLRPCRIPAAIFDKLP